MGRRGPWPLELKELDFSSSWTPPGCVTSDKLLNLSESHQPPQKGDFGTRALPGLSIGTPYRLRGLS